MWVVKFCGWNFLLVYIYIILYDIITGKKDYATTVPVKDKCGFFFHIVLFKCVKN